MSINAGLKITLTGHLPPRPPCRYRGWQWAGARTRAAGCTHSRARGEARSSPSTPAHLRTIIGNLSFALSKRVFDYYMTLDGYYFRIFQVILATASPDKFPEAVQKAEIVNKKNPEIEKLFGMETRSVPMQQGEDWEKMLRNKIAEITNKK